MKALSVMQPWARLLVGGLKRFETRSWSTDYRGGLAIHASGRMDSVATELARQLVRGRELTDEFRMGVILGVGVLVDVHRTEDLLDFGLEEQEQRFGNFARGRFAWEFAETKPLREPIEARGTLGLWDWTPPPGFEDPQ